MSFFTKLVISYLLATFACASLALKLPDVSLLNFWVVIYLLWSWPVAFLFFNFINFCVIVSFLNYITSISSTNIIEFLTNSLYSIFLTASFFITLLSLLKSTGVVFIFPITYLTTLLFKLLKIFFNLSMSTSDFKLADSFKQNLICQLLLQI